MTGSNPEFKKLVLQLLYDEYGNKPLDAQKIAENLSLPTNSVYRILEQVSPLLKMSTARTGDGKKITVYEMRDVYADMIRKNKVDGASPLDFAYKSSIQNKN